MYITRITSFPATSHPLVQSLYPRCLYSLAPVIILNVKGKDVPDGIPPRVLKELAHTLTAPLTTLFQTSLDKGAVPRDLKTAVVCPAFKKGKKYLAENYRPISHISGQQHYGAHHHKSSGELCRDKPHAVQKPTWFQEKPEL